MLIILFSLQYVLHLFAVVNMNVNQHVNYNDVDDENENEEKTEA